MPSSTTGAMHEREGAGGQWEELGVKETRTEGNGTADYWTPVAADYLPGPAIVCEIEVGRRIKCRPLREDCLVAQPLSMFSSRARSLL